MSKKLRSVNTKFWEDPFIEELCPNDKLLFIYLLTNPLCNLIGVYEITIKRMSYDTGLKIETIRKGLDGFERGEKVLYLENYVILINFLKNQNLNTNMIKGANTLIDELPKSLTDNIFENPSKGFETLRNGLVMVRKVEVEYEVESKDELENKYKNFLLKIH